MSNGYYIFLLSFLAVFFFIYLGSRFNLFISSNRKHLLHLNLMESNHIVNWMASAKISIVDLICYTLQLNANKKRIKIFMTNTNISLQFMVACVYKVHTKFRPFMSFWNCLNQTMTDGFHLHFVV